MITPTIGIGYIACTLIKTQAKLDRRSAITTLNEIIRKAYPEEYKLLEDHEIEIRKLQLETRAELLTIRNLRLHGEPQHISMIDFINSRILDREKALAEENWL